jgi:hypothetical protein
MKKRNALKFITALLFSLFACVLFAEPVAQICDTSTHQAFVGLVEFDLGLNLVAGAVMLFTRNSETVYLEGSLLAIQREIWVDYIIKNLFKDNSFMNFAYNADRFVLAGKVVHIPQAGAKANIVRNRQSLPATITTRTDTDITYAIDEFTTDPILIPNADTVELSYDAIADNLSDHMEGLQETTADWMLYNWIANIAGGGSVAPVIRTTGAATAPVGSQTGNRKMFTKDSIQRAKFLFNKANIAKEGRKMLLPSEFLDQLDSDADLLKRDYAQELDLKNGVIVRLFGFDLIERSDVAMFDNSGTPVCKLPGAALAATDNLSAFAWQQNSVERARGEVNFFERLNDPQNYGDVYSGLVRIGGRKRRKDAAGTLCIVQDTAA